MLEPEQEARCLQPNLKTQARLWGTLFGRSGSAAAATDELNYFNEGDYRLLGCDSGRFSLLSSREEALGSDYALCR